MSGHTPGPWKPCRSHEDFDGPMYDPIDEEHADEMLAKPFTSIQAKSGSVANAHDLFTFKRKDAHLIAAAPDLLSALVDIVAASDADDSGSLMESINSAKSVIAKAEGREPGE